MNTPWYAMNLRRGKQLPPAVWYIRKKKYLVRSNPDTTKCL